MIKFVLTIGAAIVASSLFASGIALGACPVGKGEGDTWCDNGTPWNASVAALNTARSYSPVVAPRTMHPSIHRTSRAL